MAFDNHLVKEVAKSVGFGNPFDVTKIDTIEKLPPSILREGYCIAHIGQGRHKFIPELAHWYHKLEPIESHEVFQWKYRKSILNQLERGEASVLSLIFNQRILFDFIYEDAVASPKIYIPGRTKYSLEYIVGHTPIKAESQQIEMDLTLEYQGTVTIIEAKNKLNTNFAVYQLFHPIKYYTGRAQAIGIKIPKINACYVQKVSKGNSPAVRMYLYNFDDLERLDSIKLIRKAEYVIYQR